MNAIAEPVRVLPPNPAPVVDAGLSAGPPPLLPAADPVVREGVLEIPGEMTLHHGGRLHGVRLAWRMAGPVNAPIVGALGGISASRRVCLGEEARPSGSESRRREAESRGWWSEFVGPDRPLDTHRFRVLSFDYLGGSGETTGPRAAERFPSVSTYDQAELLLRLLNHLGIKALAAIAGGSYGGMVALAFGERYPERAGRLIVMCAADRPHPLATAWRSVQREIVRLTLASGHAADGLKLARALAMSTYRSSEELAARFAAPPVLEADRFVFPVERYLMARGSDYAARHRPESFLCLSESIDLHRVDAGRIFVPTTAIAVREDQLVPVADIRAMVARLGAGRFHEISSIYGHDAFLKESQQLRGALAAALESN
ncbi:MAG TPA: homoserine O-succinyltransferase [Steroidobacteraceae bacterium]|nr:homoserine O-succinyltransferase [Steroidobacteraceae bacterium]